MNECENLNSSIIMEELPELGIKAVFAERSVKVGLSDLNVKCFHGHPTCVFFPRTLNRDN